MTVKRELFPGSNLEVIEGGMDRYSDGELVSRLRRSVFLYKEESAQPRDPYAKMSLGHHILELLKELRKRGFIITQTGNTFTIHTKDTAEIVKGGRIEVVDEWQMKRRIYWAVSDAMREAEKKGAKQRRMELFRAMAYLYRLWDIKLVSRELRQLVFGDEPGRELK